MLISQAVLPRARRRAANFGRKCAEYIMLMFGLLSWASRGLACMAVAVQQWSFCESGLALGDGARTGWPMVPGRATRVSRYAPSATP